MMRPTIIFMLCCCFLAARADHITGGEMYYNYLGSSGNIQHYQVTLKLFMRCNSGRQFNNPTIVSIFDKVTNERVQNITVPLTTQDMISLNNTNPCITNPPLVCYDVGYYIFDVSLPASVNGYILASQVNFRIAGISNMQTGYSQIGATYTTEIPGTAGIATGPVNNSARFTGSDLVIVCANSSFSYSFAASDPDGDQLSYMFCGAYTSTNSGQATPLLPPPFNYIPYGQGYSESAPLGNNVNVNAQTGLITGIAPPSGTYVVTVCVEERRNGVLLAVQRKDLQIRITECTIAAATLEPEYLLCRETTSLTVNNLSSSPLITSYLWQVRDVNGNSLYTSSNTALQYNFQDTGIYYVGLHINKNQLCPDSTTALVRVYPGLKTGFNSIGECFTKPTFFYDTSKLVYGAINSWFWMFEDPLNAANTSTLKDPVYTFIQSGTRNVQLVVTTTKGCRDTLNKFINIMTKPSLTLPTRDTLICNGDSVSLKAIGNGLFSWTPGTNILNANTSTPIVFPSVTTKYAVQLDDNGCLNSDTVNVRVVDFVTLSMKTDTTICLTDSLLLGASTDALRFSWSPSELVSDPARLNSFARPVGNTIFQLTASIGRCSATGYYNVQTVPYPFASAGADTTICFGTEARLQGATDGSSFSWSPLSSLSGFQTLSPIAKPAATQAYVLTAFDTRGCPKPGRDTTIVTVMPRVYAFAGNDTTVIADQPLQLNATGGVQYLWVPSQYLSLPTIANPVASFNPNAEDIRYLVYVFDAAGCYDSAFIKVKIFSTGPEVFVPTAFTPNNDGKNDVLRPIAAGMARIEYFRIYNRWGQMVFSTTTSGQGWDGRIRGQEQKTDQFVWEVKATDYKGNPYFRKGTVTLIR